MVVCLTSVYVHDFPLVLGLVVKEESSKLYVHCNSYGSHDHLWEIIYCPKLNVKKWLCSQVPL